MLFRSGLAPYRCRSLGETLPEAERLFHIRHLETRYTFLDVLTTAYYLHRHKSVAALEAARDIVGLLSRLWGEALPELAEQVTFIGEKGRTLPAPGASRRTRNPQRGHLHRVAYRYCRGGWPEVRGRLLARLKRR